MLKISWRIEWSVGQEELGGWVGDLNKNPNISAGLSVVLLPKRV